MWLCSGLYKRTPFPGEPDMAQHQAPLQKSPGHRLPGALPQALNRHSFYSFFCGSKPALSSKLIQKKQILMARN